MSACAPTDRLLQSLRTQVPGVTDDMLSLQIFNTMDEFFRRSNAWRYNIDIMMFEPENEYSFDTPADTMVVRLMGVTHQGMPVPSAASVGALQSSVGTLEPSTVFPDGDVAVDPTMSDLSNGVFTYAIYRPNYISITSLPDEEGRKYPLKAVLALTLMSSCLECDCGDWAVDEWMWNTYFQDWLDGTLSRLYTMPMKPWSSPTLGLYHGKRFRQAMSLRKQEAQRGFVYDTPTWRFPRGW